MLLLKAAGLAGLIVLVLDGLWLGVIARDWLAGQLGELKREKFLLVPGIMFYVLYSVGIAVFAIVPAMEPAMEDGGWQKAAMLGSFLGLVAYGTYDLTNLTTLKNWPLPMVIVDMVWGAVLSAVAAAGAVLILKAIG
jgi:uncharacterized membrane protein